MQILQAMQASFDALVAESCDCDIRNLSIIECNNLSELTH